jgi:hypothetical protein
MLLRSRSLHLFGNNFGEKRDGEKRFRCLWFEIPRHKIRWMCVYSEDWFMLLGLALHVFLYLNRCRCMIMMMIYYFLNTRSHCRG